MLAETPRSQTAKAIIPQYVGKTRSIELAPISLAEKSHIDSVTVGHLKMCDLSTPAGLHDFLWYLSVLGQDGLVAATSHLWNSLSEPRSYYAARIIKSAKMAGAGKAGLYAVLMAFLDDFEAKCDPPAPPDRLCYRSQEEWNAAILQHFKTGTEIMDAVIRHHMAVIDRD